LPQYSTSEEQNKNIIMSVESIKATLL
jgi:hypothetical protein